MKNLLEKSKNVGGFWRIYGIKHTILHILEFIALLILFISTMMGSVCL